MNLKNFIFKIYRWPWWET